MKRETAELLANTFYDVLRDIGLDIDNVMSFVLAAPLDAKTKAFAQRARRVGLAKELEDLPEWSSAEVSAALDAAERMRTGTQFLRKKLKEILRGLPRTPKGPKRAVPRREEPQVCADVQALVESGCERRDAIRRVARQRGAGERTIYRILEEHGKTKPRKPRKTAVK